MSVATIFYRIMRKSVENVQFDIIMTEGNFPFALKNPFMYYVAKGPPE